MDPTSNSMWFVLGVIVGSASTVMLIAIAVLGLRKRFADEPAPPRVPVPVPLALADEVPSLSAVVLNPPADVVTPRMPPAVLANDYATDLRALLQNLEVVTQSPVDDEPPLTPAEYIERRRRFHGLAGAPAVAPAVESPKASEIEP